MPSTKRRHPLSYHKTLGCLTKARYVTRAEAKTFLKRNKLDYNIYSCPFCDGFHLTSQDKASIRAIRRSISRTQRKLKQTMQSNDYLEQWTPIPDNELEKLQEEKADIESQYSKAETAREANILDDRLSTIDKRIFNLQRAIA